MRLRCPVERLNASVAKHENKMTLMRGIHRHEERVAPFHIGERVHELRQTAAGDLKKTISPNRRSINKKRCSLIDFFPNSITRLFSASRIWNSCRSFQFLNNWIQSLASLSKKTNFTDI